MGILDTHSLVIKEILRRMNDLQKEYDDLIHKDIEHDDEWIMDTTFDDAQIDAYRDALKLLLAEGEKVIFDDDGVWRIYIRWE